MKGLLVSVQAESLKMYKAKIFLFSIIFFAFIGSIMGLMMYVVHHPEIAGRSAALSAKTSLFGKGDWPAFFNLLIQVILSLGPIGFGMVTSWVFGREYADRVVKDLLALPVSRITIVMSKFIITVIWCILLIVTLFSSGLFIGLAVNIPGWSFAIAQDSFITFFNCSVLTLLLCTPVAFLACISRGYLLPVTFAILTLILTNFVAIGLPDILAYFPWAIPALYTGVAGQGLPKAGAISYFILLLTCILGFIGTAT